MNILESGSSPNFTRLHAHIVEEDGAFTVRVRLFNHLNQVESAWGEEIAGSFDLASSMIGALADQYSIGPRCVAIKIVMRRFRDGTIH